MGPWKGGKPPKGMAGLFLKNADRIIREYDRQDPMPSTPSRFSEAPSEYSKAEKIGWSIGLSVVGLALLLWAVLGSHLLAVAILLGTIGVLFLLVGFFGFRD